MLQRLFLSYIAIVSISCSRNYDDLTIAKKKKRSKELFHKEFVNHDHFGPIQGSPEKMTLLEDIINLDSTNCDAIRELSIAYLKRGLPSQWKTIYDKAVACNPKIWQPYRGCLYLYFYRDYKKAIADFNASDTLTPNFIDAPQAHSVDYWRGIAYLGLKDYTNSIYFFSKHIKDVTKKSGEDWVEPNAFIFRGICHYEANLLDNAEADFNKALKYNNNNSAESYYYKSWIALNRGAVNKALEFNAKAGEDYRLGYLMNRDYTSEVRQVYLMDITDQRKDLLRTSAE